jgi:hypothetical protein
MTITAKGHLEGDSDLFCERLTVAADEWDEAPDLALLKRVLAHPLRRARLLDLAERVEAEDLAQASAAP